MKTCTYQEAMSVIARNGHPAPEYSFGKRYAQVRYVVCGKLIAQRDDYLTRARSRQSVDGRPAE